MGKTFDMHSRRARLVAGLFVGIVALTAPRMALAADGYSLFSKKGVFEDVVDNLNEAIIKRGYVVDFTGEFNKMLERTAKDVGVKTPSGLATPYRNAKFLQFCPAKLTHESVSVNPFGIANCPIAIFVYETVKEPGKINVGFRSPVPSSSRKVAEVNKRLEATLADIARDAVK